MTQANPDLPPQHSTPDPDRPHKPVDDREEIYFEGTPMIRGELGKFFGFALVVALLFAIPFVWYAMRNKWPSWWLTAACYVVGILILLIPWILTKFIHYRISNYRIDFERGLISKKIDTLELWHVDDISFRAGLIDRVMGTGTITIISNDDTTPRLELQSLPKARPLFDQLKQRVIAVKRQRGVIKMDMG